MLLGEAYQSLVGLHTGIATRRHIRIVRPHEFHLRKIHLFEFIEVWLPAIVLTQIVVHNLRTKYFAQRCVGGIAGIGHQYLVARIDEGEGDMQNTLFRTYQRQDLRLWVEIYVVPTLVEASHRLTEFWRTHRGLIAVGIRLMSHLTEFVDGLGGRWHIRTAHGETDDILALGIQLRHFLQFPTEIILTDERQALCGFNWSVCHLYILLISLNPLLMG